jgi:hypothetical protein
VGTCGKTKSRHSSVSSATKDEIVLLTKSKSNEPSSKRKPTLNIHTMSSTKTHPYNPAQSNNNTHHYEEEISVNATVVSDHEGGSPATHASPAAVSYNENSIVDIPRYVRICTRKPVVLTHCPKCAKAHVATTTRTKATGATWLGVVAGVIIFWPLCWIPLVVEPMKQTNHYCQRCGVKVGRVKPFQ